MKIELELEIRSVLRAAVGLILVGVFLGNVLDAILLQVTDTHIPMFAVKVFEWFHESSDLADSNIVEGLVEIAFGAVLGSPAYWLLTKSFRLTGE